MKIWIVVGQTGEYSDRTEWMVGAYRSEAAAQVRVVELSRLIQHAPRSNIVNEFDKWEDRRERVAFIRSHPDGDPSYQEDYTGTAYYPSVCELEDEA